MLNLKRTLALLVLCLVITGSSWVAFAATKAENLAYQYPSFQAAHDASSYIRFQMVHRKLGFASKFDGTVKAFTVNGNLKANQFEHAVVKFSVLDMDTNNSARNSKMYTDSLKAKSFPSATMTFNMPLRVGEQTVPGTFEILGSRHQIQLPITIQTTDYGYKATGQASLSRSELGIPKPSFISEAIASVDDQVKVFYQLSIARTQL